ncbi:MAG: exodeoxyribonuclease III [Bacteroidales bacterium]|nr:exodeoxyribonuclease III [Bacteroidales bacterium]
MKIVSYNVNGIRAAIGKGFIEWLDQSGADVVCIQESKAQHDQIPLMEFETIGYQTFWHSAEKKGYSGVGILTKIKPDNIKVGIGIPEYDREGRFLRADFGDLSIVSVYHPSGSSGDERQAFKMKWLDDFHKKVNELKKERPNLIISGDYNICHKEIDIHDPKGNKNNSGFLPEEREWIGKFIDSGFIDTFREFHPEPDRYSWWSYRRQARDRNLGWRIDYHMVTENLKGRLQNADILDQVVHSDHCPITLEIE